MIVKNPLGYAFEIGKALILNQNIPLAITILPTNNCNFNCSYCNIHNIRKNHTIGKKTEEMTTEQIMRCIDEFAEMGTRKIGFSGGGESLLREDIGQLITYAKKKGMMTTLSSNGFLVKEKIAELKNLDILFLSFDGPEEVQGKTRRNANILDTIELVNKTKTKIWTATVLSNAAIPHLDYIFKTSKEYNFKMLFAPIYSNWYLNNKNNESLLRPDLEEFRKAIFKIEAAKKQGYGILNSQIYLNLLKKWPNSQIKNCLAARRHCVIDPYGNLYPCCGLVEKTASINGLELGFKEAYQRLAQGFKICPEQNSCFYVAPLELNYIFSLRPSLYLDTIKSLI